MFLLKKTERPLEAMSREKKNLPRPEEQSRTCGCQSGSVEDQPQCQGLWHSSNPHARSLSHSSSPSFFHTISLSPRSLVRDGQTSPHRPRLVVSRSTCPPLSSAPHANSFVIGSAVIKHIPGRAGSVLGLHSRRSIVGSNKTHTHPSCGHGWLKKIQTDRQTY
jgi:hypothetical protein